MLRSFLYAIGIFLLILGAQTLVVDKWIMSQEKQFGPIATQNSRNLNPANPYRSAAYSRSRFGNQNYYNQRDRATSTFKPVYQTRDWMPWSLLAAGTIIVLYTYSTGRRYSD